MNAEKNRVLIIDDESEIREIIHMVVESVCDYPVIEASSGNQALKLLKENPEAYILVLTDYDMPDGKGDIVWKFVKDNMNAPLFLLTAREMDELPEFSDLLQSNELNHHFIKPFDFQKLVATCDKVLEHLMKASGVELTNQSYKKIRLTRFKNLSESCCDIYVKLSDDKYVKIYSSKNGGLREQLENYERKGVEYLYIEHGKMLGFLKERFEDINKALENARDIKSIKQAATDSHEYVYQCLHSIGISQMQIELVEKTVETTLKRFGKDKNLKHLIHLFKGDNFIVNHSLMSMHIASSMLKKMGKGDDLMLSKMCMACFLHDMDIDDPTQCKEENNVTDLSEKKKVDMISHAKSASDALAKIDTIPIDVITIIRDHHEKPDASGYPMGKKSDQINLMTSVFILAHDFSTRVLRGQYDESNYKLFLEDFGPFYSTGKFGDAMNALMSMIG